jgi:hypothetical protein
VIYISCPEPGTPEWKDWQRRALAKLADLEKLAALHMPSTSRDANGKVTSAVKIHDLYKDRDAGVFEKFGKRCAYCESPMKATDFGDVDHFRPKFAVQTLVKAGRGKAEKPLCRKTERSWETLVRRPVEVTFADGSRGAHPGYYWLAYAWSNLLPACSLCNKGHYSDTSYGVGKKKVYPYVGKEALFPVVGDANTLDPSSAAIAAERPLLINPSLDDPSKDLELEGASGTLSPRRLANGKLSDRGRTTIAVLDLNRTELVTRRKSAYVNFLLLLGSLQRRAIEYSAAEARRTDEWKEFQGYLAGRLPYMLALRTAHQEFRARLTHAAALLTIPPDAPPPGDGEPTVPVDAPQPGAGEPEVPAGELQPVAGAPV